MLGNVTPEDVVLLGRVAVAVAVVVLFTIAWARYPTLRLPRRPATRAHCPGCLIDLQTNPNVGWSQQPPGSHGTHQAVTVIRFLCPCRTESWWVFEDRQRPRCVNYCRVGLPIRKTHTPHSASGAYGVQTQ